MTAPASPDADSLLARLIGPAGPQLSCEECFEQLDHYVELELVGADADAAVPGMQAHLEGCSAQPKGVGVVLEAGHSCMSLRGVQKSGANTVTSALHGLVRDDPRTRAEFLSLTGRRTR